MTLHRRLLLSAVLLAVGISPAMTPRARATVAVSNYFASHMVVQRGSPITVYGTGAAGEVVVATFNGGTASATTNSAGNWTLSLPAQAAGGPYTLNLTGPTNAIALTDVLVGDLWLCSGQSNMAFIMQPYSPYTFGVLNYQSEIAAASYSNLRFFNTTTKYPATEAAQVYGAWTVCAPSAAGNYYGIAYYFARKVYAQTGVPIGMVQSALGSTSINSWIDKPTLNGLGTTTTGTGEFDPGNCFDGMIAPLTTIPMKGFLWCQGEADTYFASSYATRMRALIGDWRGRWNNQNMPFYYVQLANYDPTQSYDVANKVATPGGSYNASWAKLRLAQSAALDTALTGMATAADVGDPTWIHPQDKKTVGERLAAVALAGTYGQNVVSTGPTYAGEQAGGSSLVVSYNAASLGSGLVVKSGASLTGFEVAGPDGVFYPASAAINGSTVVLSCPSVPSPQDARYAWGNNPTLTLYNVEGFPALPFLTTAVPADSNGYPVQDPTTAHQDGSEGHWQFNGNNFDASGNVHALTLVGSPTYSTDAKEGTNSVVLDGATQYGDAGTYDAGSRFTIAAWVKVATGRSSIQTILSNSNGGTATGFRLYVNTYQTSDGRFVLETCNGSALAKATSVSAAATPGTWQYVVVSADKVAGTARVYVDGVDRTEAGTIRTDFATSGDVNVGRMDSSGYLLGGQLDDVQILPGAFTTAQVKDLMVSGLTARWSFELNGGDRTGHNNFLTAVGGATYAPGPVPVGSYAAALNGAGQRYSAGAQNLGSAYTVTLWAKIPTGATGNQTLAANAAGGSASGFQFYANVNSGQLGFATGTGSAAASKLSAGGVFAPDQWNHVAVTVDNTAGVATLYYGGSAVTTSGSLLTGAQTTGTLILGALTDGSAALTGNLDDVRVYNRALTAQEIAILAAAPGNLPPTASAITAAVDEGSNVTVDALAGASDPDGGPSSLRLLHVGTPTNGTASLVGGKVLYTPAAGFIGSDAFTYTVTDGLANAAATVSVTVQPSFSGFQSAYFNAQQLADPTISGPLAPRATMG